MSGLPPTLYHRYTENVYRITILPDGVEVKRLATGTSSAAKSISFEAVPRLRNGKSWNSAVAETLIRRYERQLIVDQDKP
ncbi:MAG: hypothetical protein ACYDBJ_25600 [Aggregatilineales bacterium]